MVTHMKTTIEISDDVLLRVKELAHRESTTLRSVVEAALRLFLREHDKPRHQGHIEPVTDPGGSGLSPEARRLTWMQLMDAVNERENAA